VGEPARGARDHLPLDLACRDGGRHPGRREGVALRGASSERGSWSVRLLSWVPPAGATRRRQRMSGGRRGGERSRACALSVCTRRKHERSSHAPGRRVLRSVLRPVLVNPHYTRDGQTSRGGAFVSASRLGKPAQAGRTSTGVGWAGVARLAACHRFRKGEAWHVRKGRRSRPPSLRGNESTGSLVAHRARCRSQQATSGLE